MAIILFLFPAAAALLFVLLKDAPDRFRLYNLLQAKPGDTIVIFSANIRVPPLSAHTWYGKLRFSGFVIALEEYFAGHQLSSLLEKDILAIYPTFLRDAIYYVFPQSRPLKSLLRVAPMDIHEMGRVADEYGLREPVSIISLGSPGSNWLTAYVSETQPGWFKFGMDRDYIKEDRGENRGQTYCYRPDYMSRFSSFRV